MPAPDLLARDQLLALCGVGGRDLTVQLYGNNLHPDTGTVAADLVRPAFAGYEPMSSQKWVGPLNLPNGVAVITSPPFTWVHLDNNVASTAVYGFDVTSNAAGIVPPKTLTITRLDPPVSLRKMGATLELQVTLYASHDTDPTKVEMVIVCEFAQRADTDSLPRNTRGLVRRLRRTLVQIGNADFRAFEQAAKDGVDRLLFYGDPDTTSAASELSKRADALLLRK